MASLILDKKGGGKNKILSHRPSIPSLRPRIYLLRALENLDLLHGDRRCGADFDTAFAAQAFIHVDRLGFSVLDFEYANRTGIYTLPLSVALLLIYLHFIHGYLFTSSIGLRCSLLAHFILTGPPSD
jgi:hypothetical protein